MANPVGAKKPVRESCIPFRGDQIFWEFFQGGESHPFFFDTETMLRVGDLPSGELT